MTPQQQILAEKYKGYWMTKIDEDYPVPFHPEAFDSSIYELIPPGQSKPAPKKEPVIRQAHSKPNKSSKPEPAIEGEAIRVEDAPIGGLDESNFSFSDEDL
jgi:hypothetical protein